VSDLFDRRSVPLHVQIAAAEREVKQRERVYPRWVSDGRMTQAKADHEIAAMKAIVETLRGLPA
jgi:hypothetical protein